MSETRICSKQCNKPNDRWWDNTKCKIISKGDKLNEYQIAILNDYEYNIMTKSKQFTIKILALFQVTQLKKYFKIFETLSF